MKYFCKDCGKEISWTGHNGGGRCKSCSHKGKLHHFFGKKRPEISGSNNPIYRERTPEYLEELKKKKREYHQKLYIKNKEKILKRSKKYYKIHKKQKIEQSRIYKQNKYKTDINFRLKGALRCRISSALRNNRASCHTIELLGCSVEFLKSHLEKQFTKGMNWSNWGKGRNKWQVDHIIPCCKFNFTNVTEQYKCFNYTNLQPLWTIDNIIKGNKLR